MAVSYAISQGVAHKALTVSKSFLAGLFMTLIAMSLTTNMASYAFAVLLIIFAVGRRKYRPSRLRKSLLLVTLTMVIWGTFLGFLNGHNPGYILRFASPFTLFALFLMCRNLGSDVYCHRKSLGLIALAFSLFAFLLTKLGLNDLSLLILRGWTLSFSASSAVAIWHYFALSISVSLIFDALLVKKSANNTLYMWVGLATIVLLGLTTKTSAFDLAIAAAFLPILLARVQPRLIERIVLIVGVAVVLDYMFFEILTNSLIQGLWDSIALDEGNEIRLIQIEYFRSNFLLLGNGFGPELDFRFFGLGNREISQEAFPYASELPIFNVIHGAGVFAVVWFILILRLLLALMADAGRLSGTVQGKAYFAYAMSLVLYGSISNPFLFSPVSMLMIVIALDLFEEYRQPLRTPRAGS
tara:strand:- start:129 stop:1364 length:1236 start_codon:yes stop_codon:yes gene_type:complete